MLCIKGVITDYRDYRGKLPYRNTRHTYVCEKVFTYARKKTVIGNQSRVFRLTMRV